MDQLIILLWAVCFLIYFGVLLANIPKIDCQKEDVFCAIIWPLLVVKALLVWSVELVIFTFKKLFMEW